MKMTCMYNNFVRLGINKILAINLVTRFYHNVK